MTLSTRSVFRFSLLATFLVSSAWAGDARFFTAYAKTVQVQVDTRQLLDDLGDPAHQNEDICFQLGGLRAHAQIMAQKLADDSLPFPSSVQDLNGDLRGRRYLLSEFCQSSAARTFADVIRPGDRADLRVQLGFFSRETATISDVLHHLVWDN